MSKLILVRHAESLWNKENRFTGDIDVGLSLHGIEQALEEAKKIPSFTKVYTSTLFRCKMTAAILLAKMKKTFAFGGQKREGLDFDLIEDARLNERDYGDLKGENKQEVLAKYGEAQFVQWRRGYASRPPGGESLADVVVRVNNFLKTALLADLEGGEDVLIVAHGNSLRALVKILEGLSDEEVVHLEIPVMGMRIYEMKNGAFGRLDG